MTNLYLTNLKRTQNALIITQQFRYLSYFESQAVFLQKQSPEVFYNKRCSSKFCKIHRKIPGFKPAALLKRRLWHRCFPMNFAKFPRTLFYRKPPDYCFCLYFKNSNLWWLFGVVKSARFNFHIAEQVRQ